MGDQSSVFVAILIGLTGGFAPAAAWAIDDESILEPVLTVTSDAEKGLKCLVQISVDTTGATNGLQLDCTDSNPTSHFFTVDQLRQGVPLVHQDSKNIDVITLAIPDLDPVQGGAIKLHYLQSYVGKQYQDWAGEAVNNGGQWVLYTSPDSDHTPFNQLFAKKNTFLGKTDGVKSIRVSWVEPLASVKP